MKLNEKEIRLSHFNGTHAHTQGSLKCDLCSQAGTDFLS